MYIHWTHAGWGSQWPSTLRHKILSPEQPLTPCRAVGQPKKKNNSIGLNFYIICTQTHAHLPYANLLLWEKTPCGLVWYVLPVTRWGGSKMFWGSLAKSYLPLLPLTSGVPYMPLVVSKGPSASVAGVGSRAQTETFGSTLRGLSLSWTEWRVRRDTRALNVCVGLVRSIRGFGQIEGPDVIHAHAHWMSALALKRH
jgi:hypothetical protein